MRNNSTCDTEQYRTIGWVYKSIQNIQNDLQEQYGMIQNDWLGIQEHTKQFAQQIRAIQINLKPSLQLDKSIDPNTDKCTFPPVQKQGMIEKVLQVGLGGTNRKDWEGCTFGLAFENC
jgi:hypothetical protein